MEANHSKKPIRESGSSPIYNLAQPHKLHTKEVFNFWIANTPPLKASLFLSFQIIQKMYSGMDFLSFFPQKIYAEQYFFLSNFMWNATTIFQWSFQTFRC